GRSWIGTSFWVAVATVTGTGGICGGCADWELQPKHTTPKAAIKQNKGLKRLSGDKVDLFQILKLVYPLFHHNRLSCNECYTESG
ncbi:MAG TPA: hypothetical protein VFO27_08040, partial [Bryobacteraceae bacterium]|nr:hypothetical protein [Bryobacteraceae bacterium]